jgi:hypothetical protein
MLHLYTTGRVPCLDRQVRHLSCDELLDSLLGTARAAMPVVLLGRTAT